MTAGRRVIVECKAILFDMDGTLVDSTPVVERQWKRFAGKYGLDYGEIMKVSHGRRNEETIREIAPHLARPEVFAEFDAAEIEDRGGIEAVRGAAALIQELKENDWAVVTSASRELARSRLAAVYLPIPRVLVGADDVKHGKPDPEGYLTAARWLGIESASCVVFEDTRPGLEAAYAAGMRGIGVATTFLPTELRARECMPDFEGARMERLPEGGIRLTFLCY
jgi:sugar-phosphatase